MRVQPLSPGRLPFGKSGRGVRLPALLLLCLLTTACPATGGDLLPLREGGAGELESASFKDDTLVVRRNQVALRARGSWSASDSGTVVTLEVINAGRSDAAIAFDNLEMMNKESREQLSLRSMAEYKGGGPPAFMAERNVIVAAGQTKKYDLNFYVKPGDGRGSVSKNVLGQTVTLRVPVGLGGETTAPADFLFSFKYVEYQH
jgi:hypothetical protein